MDVEHVVEVLPMLAVEALPGGPDVIEGVILVGDEVVPVVDLARRLGAPPTSLRVEDHLVLLKTDSCRLALHVERAVDVVTLEPMALGQAQDLVPGAMFISGAASDARSVVFFTEPGILLRDDEASALAACLTERERRPVEVV